MDLDHGITTPKYGGGMGSNRSADALAKDGIYPGAVELGGRDRGSHAEHSYVDDHGQLHIELPPGKHLGGFEVAVGDTKFDESRPARDQRNKDGHVGRLGWAKLSARLANGNKRGEPFMRRINVPPSGVLSGGPIQRDYLTKAGDEIIVDASSQAWVMGYRVQFMG